MMNYDNRKEKAAAWFKSLRDEICTEFEVLESEAPEALYPGTPGRFEYEDWQRKVENSTSEDLGGGTGGMLRGRLFEKCGVHISVVKGEFTPEMAAKTPGGRQGSKILGGGRVSYRAST